MRDREKLCRVGFWVVLACVFAVMLVFNHLTPLVGDDYVYAFSFVDHGVAELGHRYGNKRGRSPMRSRLNAQEQHVQIRVPRIP